MNPHLHQRVFLVTGVTGVTGAIGKAIARQLAVLANSKIVLVCRDRGRAEATVKELTQQTQSQSISHELADVSRYQDIQQLAQRWTGPLHVLINNAACAPRSRLETPEGIELQFAANVLGYFWLKQAFTEI